MKIQVSAILLFGGVWCVAASYNYTCVNKEVLPCTQAIENIYPDDAWMMCKELNFIDKCLERALKTCEVENILDLTEIMKVVDELCTAEGDLNLKFYRNLECFKKVFVKEDQAFLTCVNQVFPPQNYTERPTPERIVEFYIEMFSKKCSEIPDGVTCVAKEVHDKCGDEAKEVFITLSNPALKLYNDKLCPRAGGASGINAISWIVFLSTAVFLSVWN